MKIKLTWRIWLLIILLVFSLLSIFGNPFDLGKSGVIIKSVNQSSSAFEQGLRQDQIITSIDGEEINSLEDYSNIISKKFISEEKIKTIIKTPESEIILFTNSPPDITVSEIPKTNIKLGLDLEGGSRALVKAEGRDLSQEEVRDLVDVVSNRLNVYGLTDLKVAPVSDLSGNNFMLIEIAGATPNDLEELISQQGKFEAKIGNETVFVGGQENGIADVCKNAQCSRVESPQTLASGGYTSRFSFTVTLKQKAAEKQAEITSKLGIDSSNPQYLEKKLDFYIDDKFLEDQSLFISEGLKGRVTTQIQISGSGEGTTQDEAIEDAQESMKKLQTILTTGSLPYKLEIVKLDTVSPLLGTEFLKSILIVAVVSLSVVGFIILIRYKKLKSSLALLVTSTSEVIIILGVAAFIGWNLDLPSIAGILATIGTGIDDLIVVIDESIQKSVLSLKQKLKRAFAIILGAYFTTLVSLFPLLWAGAGLLKGFAVTTIIGITTGILITRPAFTDMIKGIEG